MARFEFTMWQGESGRLYLTMKPSSIVGESYVYDALTGEKLAEHLYLDQLEGTPPTPHESDPWVREVPLEEWPAKTKAWVGSATDGSALYVSRPLPGGGWEDLWLGAKCEVVARTEWGNSSADSTLHALEMDRHKEEAKRQCKVEDIPF